MKTGHALCSTSEGNRTRAVAMAMKLASAASIAVLLGSLIQPTAAVAGTINYGFTYTDTSGVLAWGTLHSSDVPSDIAGNPGGAGYLVTSGSITVATPASAVAATTTAPFTTQLNVADGTYPLLAISPPPSPQTPEGDTIDNLVYPGNNAGSGTSPGVSSPSYITTNGIEFAYPIGSSPNNETFIGIFAYGNNNYALGWSPDGTHGNFDSPTINRNGLFPGSAFPGGGTFALFVLPEPSSLMLLAVAGIAAVGYGLRRRNA